MRNQHNGDKPQHYYRLDEETVYKKNNDNYDKKLYFAEKLISMFEFLKLLDYEKDIECDNFILKDI